MSKVTTADRLNSARAQLEETSKQILTLEDQRSAVLLGDDDVRAAKMQLELEKLRALRAGHADKIKLLEAAQTKEQEKQREREREARLRKFEEIVTSPEALGTRLQEAAANLEKEFRATIEARESARTMWPYGLSSHMDMAAVSASACALSAAAVAELLSHELFRVGKKLPSGEHGAPVPQSLPGPRAPSLSLLGQPEAIQPLSEKLRQASAFAVRQLRSGSAKPLEPEPRAPVPKAPATAPAVQPASATPAAPAPHPEPQPTYVAGTEDTQRMKELNMRLVSLANDISSQGELAYKACLEDIRRHEDAMRAKMAVA